MSAFDVPERDPNPPAEWECPRCQQCMFVELRDGHVCEDLIPEKEEDDEW